MRARARAGVGVRACVGGRERAYVRISVSLCQCVTVSVCQCVQFRVV